MTSARRRGLGILERYRSFESDARRFLLLTLVASAASSLWWVDFNLYLRSLGVSTSGVGLLTTLGLVASAVSALGVGAISGRLGRRRLLRLGLGAALAAAVGLALSAGPLALIALAALWSGGMAVIQVISAPFLTDHSRPENRNDLFAVQFAISTSAAFVAAGIGGIGAQRAAAMLGLAASSPGTYRLILVAMAVLVALSMASTTAIRDDRPSPSKPGTIGGPPAEPPGRQQPHVRYGISDPFRVARVLLPPFLIAVGAGQVIPFLNIYVQERFGLDVASLNAAFAATSIGTTVAILLQPLAAERFGRIRSVVIVQAMSIPFLIVLGFSSSLPLVLAAMTVRGSLMNAANPIFNAFAMDQVPAAERAQLSALLSAQYAVGWIVGGGFFAAVHAVVHDFETSYSINFSVITVLYSLGTLLYWRWFRATDSDGLSLAHVGVTTRAG